MRHIVHISLPQSCSQPAEAEPAECIRTFVVSANLAAQEACGDTAASTSPSRVLTRLAGSQESTTYLFGLAAGPLPPLEVGPLGFPVLPAAAPSPDVDFEGFIHISTPLLEEKHNAELECVLELGQLPLPGTEVDEHTRELTQELAQRGIEIARQLGRSIIQVGVLYPAGMTADYDPMASTYRSLGFSHKHTESQLMIPVPAQPLVPFLGAQCRVEVWQDYDIPDEHVDAFLNLLTVASIDSYFGQLSVEPILWTRERLAGAHARLRSRRSHTLVAALISEGKLIALSELSTQELGDPTVAEWTLTVVDREYRRRGCGWQAKLAALQACAKLWPRVQRTYTSIPQEDKALGTLNSRLGAQVLSHSAAWELTLD